MEHTKCEKCGAIDRLYCYDLTPRRLEAEGGGLVMGNELWEIGSFGSDENYCDSCGEEVEGLIVNECEECGEMCEEKDNKCKRCSLVIDLADLKTKGA
jgi:predicted RNA-binding Zn-ribbon protein involved in translation (DUF1610 family)